MLASALPFLLRWQRPRDEVEVCSKMEGQVCPDTGGSEAAEKVEDFFLATSVWPQLLDQDRAMLRS